MMDERRSIEEEISMEVGRACFDVQ